MTSTASQLNGRKLFAGIGCAMCHSPSLTTGHSAFTGMGNIAYAPYSDFALHNTGPLGDGITQGNAGPNDFRTAPLWGLGQRLFFLHDGRTGDLLTAIQHGCPVGPQGEQPPPCNSEAAQVAGQFARPAAQQKQDLLNFLRSL